MWFWTLSLQNVLATVQREKKPENISGISEAFLPLSLSLPRRSPLSPAHLPAEVLSLSSCLFSATTRLTHSNSHGCQEVLGDFLFASILFQGHGAKVSYTHSCTFARWGIDAVVRITLNAADSLKLHKLLKSNSHQLRIMLHMLQFPSKPLFLPGLWRHIASHYSWDKQDIAKHVRVWQKSQAVLQCTWYFTL